MTTKRLDVDVELVLDQLRERYGAATLRAERTEKGWILLAQYADGRTELVEFAQLMEQLTH